MPSIITNGERPRSVWPKLLVLWVPGASPGTVWPRIWPMSVVRADCSSISSRLTTVTAAGTSRADVRVRVASRSGKPAPGDMPTPDDTEVVFLSDHGELLGEHGLWNHSISLHPELIEVPLVVSGPGFADETRRDHVSLLDVHRTVADLLDADVSSRGRDLRDPLDPEPLLPGCERRLPPRDLEANGQSLGIQEQMFGSREVRGPSSR